VRGYRSVRGLSQQLFFTFLGGERPRMTRLRRGYGVGGTEGGSPNSSCLLVSIRGLFIILLRELCSEVLKNLKNLYAELRRFLITD